MGILSDKKGVILGVGNQRSIAWAVAEHFHEQGAEIALTYLADPKGRFEANVRKLGDKVNASLIQECDVSTDDSSGSCTEHCYCISHYFLYCLGDFNG